jgi:hypothetical protein
MNPINPNPHSCAMPPPVRSTSGEQDPTLEDKIAAIANISFPSNPADILIIAQDTQAREESGSNIDCIDATGITACPTMIKELLKRTCNTTLPGHNGIGWRGVNICSN